VHYFFFFTRNEKTKIIIYNKKDISFPPFKPLVKFKLKNLKRFSVDKINEELARPQKRKQETGSVEIKSHETARIPNMSFEDSIEHVLKLITEKPMTSRDIEVTFGGRSREHVSRLMKKLFDDGFVERNTAKRPYTYSITDSGKGRIGSKENIVYAVSQ
jgi:predicted transcriptional regulator